MNFPSAPGRIATPRLNAAAGAAAFCARSPPEQIAKFLTRFAERIEARKNELVEIAHAETALPKAPRLADVELPRTTGQLRQAAAAALEGSWAMPTIDTKLNIRSRARAASARSGFSGRIIFRSPSTASRAGILPPPLPPGNPVIAKANTSHPGTSRLLAEEAFSAVTEAGLPPATVQLIYRTSHADGERLVADPRTGATGYTGSRGAGLKLKAAADRVGQAGLCRTFQRESGGDFAGRAGGARRETGGGIHRQLPDGHGTILHQSELDRSVRGRRGGTIHRGVRNKSWKPRRRRRCFPPACSGSWMKA